MCESLQSFPRCSDGWADSYAEGGLSVGCYKRNYDPRTVIDFSTGDCAASGSNQSTMGPAVANSSSSGSAMAEVASEPKDKDKDLLCCCNGHTMKYIKGAALLILFGVAVYYATSARRRGRRRRKK